LDAAKIFAGYAPTTKDRFPPFFQVNVADSALIEHLQRTAVSPRFSVLTASCRE
jgi:hypothetical protein